MSMGSAAALNTAGNQGTIHAASKSNHDFIQKAAIQVATFSPGGVLLPKQVERFVEIGIVKSKLLKQCNVQIIPAPTYEQDKLGFTGQVLHPDEEDVAFAADDLAVPETGKIQYVSKRYKAEIGLTYDTVKRVIQGNDLMSYLIERLAEAALRDLEIAALRGDTSLTPTTALNRLLRKQDGFLKRVQANVVDAEGARLNLDLLDDARRMMPDEYFDQDGLQFLTTKNGRIDYEAAVAARATELGDRVFASQNDVRYKGVHPVVPVPLFPKDITYAGEAKHTNILFTNPSTQLRVGYLEEMNIRTAEDIRAGKFIAVLRFDVAFTILHDEANVKIINVRNDE